MGGQPLFGTFPKKSDLESQCFPKKEMEVWIQFSLNDSRSRQSSQLHPVELRWIKKRRRQGRKRQLKFEVAAEHFQKLTKKGSETLDIWRSQLKHG